jgi:hypothetical protein
MNQLFPKSISEEYRTLRAEHEQLSLERRVLLEERLKLVQRVQHLEAEIYRMRHGQIIADKDKERRQPQKYNINSLYALLAHLTIGQPFNTEVLLTVLKYKQGDRNNTKTVLRTWSERDYLSTNNAGESYTMTAAGLLFFRKQIMQQIGADINE